MATKRETALRVAFGVFVASVAMLSFGYGFVAERYRFFPYAIVDTGIKGMKALVALSDESLMTGLVATDPQAPTVPRVTWSLPEAGTERLLVVGGFYQRMDRCPRFGCLAWVMARDGTVSHSWEVDPHELSAGIEGFYGSVRAENIYPVGAALGPDGHLVLTFDGRNMWPYQVGMAKLSADGHIIWKRFERASLD